MVEKKHRKRGMVEAGNFWPERGERRRLDEKKTTKTNKNMEKNILEKTKSLIGWPITNHYQHLELQTRGNNIIQTESDMDITTSVQIRQDILAMQCNAKLGVLLYFLLSPLWLVARISRHRKDQ